MKTIFQLTGAIAIAAVMAFSPAKPRATSPLRDERHPTAETTAEIVEQPAQEVTTPAPAVSFVDHAMPSVVPVAISESTAASVAPKFTAPQPVRYTTYQSACGPNGCGPAYSSGYQRRGIPILRRLRGR